MMIRHNLLRGEDKAKMNSAARREEEGIPTGRQTEKMEMLLFRADVTFLCCAHATLRLTSQETFIQSRNLTSKSQKRHFSVLASHPRSQLHDLSRIQVYIHTGRLTSDLSTSSWHGVAINDG